MTAIVTNNLRRRAMECSDKPVPVEITIAPVSAEQMENNTSTLLSLMARLGGVVMNHEGRFNSGNNSEIAKVSVPAGKLDDLAKWPSARVLSEPGENVTAVLNASSGSASRQHGESYTPFRPDPHARDMQIRHEYEFQRSHGLRR